MLGGRGVYCHEVWEGRVSTVMRVGGMGVYCHEGLEGGVSTVMRVGREQCLLS